MREAAALLWGNSLVSRKTHAPLCSVAAVARSDPQKCSSGQAERKLGTRCSGEITHQTPVKDRGTGFSGASAVEERDFT